MAPARSPVEVWFDGAWIRNPAGESSLWGYGYKVVGGGLDRVESHTPLIGHLVGLLSLLVSIDDDDQAEVPSVIRSVQVADLDAAHAALFYLKEKGYSGRVVMYGDCKPLLERLAAGTTIRPGAADSRAIALREKLVREATVGFASVDWVWISSDQNREADALAWIAVHQLIEHKKAVLKSARSHPDRGRWVPLVEMAARRLYPGDILERDIDQMQCLCRRCRPESAGSRPEQEDTGD